MPDRTKCILLFSVMIKQGMPSSEGLARVLCCVCAKRDRCVGLHWISMECGTAGVGCFVSDARHSLTVWCVQVLFSSRTDSLSYCH
jgi:hypothetical protein